MLWWGQIWAECLGNPRRIKVQSVTTIKKYVSEDQNKSGWKIQGIDQNTESEDQTHCTMNQY